MSTIRLKNIKIYAFHGCMLEEGQIGSDYLVNLKVKADLDKAENSDDLHDTVDYVLLNKIVKEEMAIRSAVTMWRQCRSLNLRMYFAASRTATLPTMGNMFPSLSILRACLNT